MNANDLSNPHDIRIYNIGQWLMTIKNIVVTIQ